MADVKALKRTVSVFWMRQRPLQQNSVCKQRPRLVRSQQMPQTVPQQQKKQLPSLKLLCRCPTPARSWLLKDQGQFQSREIRR